MERLAAVFDWDAGNRDKYQGHGLSIEEVEHVVAHNETVIVPDLRHSHVERRMIAIGRTPSGRYVFVAFTQRRIGGQSVLRPISTRYMHHKEVRRYEEEISRAQNR